MSRSINCPASRTLSAWSHLLKVEQRAPRACYRAQWLQARGKVTTAHQSPDVVPLRKLLKDKAKRERSEKRSSQNTSEERVGKDARDEKWKLTVGIEVHAQLNTKNKLFSDALILQDDAESIPNDHVALFDAATPGSQPSFQIATILPAIRAALALGCTIQNGSSWDRKHYFHWDQPNGYQLTQYYQPFARDGELILTAEDGVPAAELDGKDKLVIGIKQIQMEQDTAKTTAHPNATYHIDLNRAGHPLIEIITLPQIHSPQTAAAVVRKIQAILKSVNACIIGMELGGLRADVNVSVRERNTSGQFQYSGVAGLGQRTEIKNLSSFKAVEDAILAERNRQINVLEAGGVIEGETRGWTLGSTETTRLRGKEGEVDYRYTPDPDLPPLFIGDDLIEHLRSSLPELPDQTIARIQAAYDLSLKDAKTIYSLDDGDRLELMEATVFLLRQQLKSDKIDDKKINKTVSNWLLHEIGAILSHPSRSNAQLEISPSELADVLCNLLQKQITANTAKSLLITLQDLHDPDRPTVEQLIEQGNLRLQPMSTSQYQDLAKDIIQQNPDMVKAVKEKGQTGKIMWFVGQMVRRSAEGTVEPEVARKVVEEVIGV